MITIKPAITTIKYLIIIMIYGTSSGVNFWLDKLLNPKYNIPSSNIQPLNLHFFAKIKSSLLRKESLPVSRVLMHDFVIFGCG